MGSRHLFAARSNFSQHRGDNVMHVLPVRLGGPDCLDSGRSAFRLSIYILPFQGTTRRSMKRIRRSKQKAITAITKIPMITTGVCKNWLADSTM